MAKKQYTALSAAALSALEAAQYKENTFRLTQKGLACYPEIKAFVAALGGRWVTRSGLHEFAPGIDALPLVRCEMARGIPPSNPNDFYPTPQDCARGLIDEWIADRLESLRISAVFDKRPMHFLEPSAGFGAIADVLRGLMRPGDALTLVEQNPLSAAVLRDKFPCATVVEADFLSYVPNQQFDVAFLNPPFDKHAYQRHLRRAFSFLRPYGVLASIAPLGFTEMDCDYPFLQFVNQNGDWQTIEGTPFDGVKIPTCYIRMEKDPDAAWRDKPHEGFTTYHAWDATTAISSDGDVLRLLKANPGFEQQLGILETWARQMNREFHQYCVITPDIAREVLAELAVRALIGAPSAPSEPPHQEPTLAPVIAGDFARSETPAQETQLALSI